MRDLILNAANWNTADDLHDVFFAAVGAPEWHGRNFDALSDSIVVGKINKIEVPYRLVIRNYDRVGVGAKKMTDDFIDLVRELAVHGTPVEITVQDSC